MHTSVSFTFVLQKFFLQANSWIFFFLLFLKRGDKNFKQELSLLQCIFISYPHRQKGNGLNNPTTKVVFVSRNVILHERFFSTNIKTTSTLKQFFLHVSSIQPDFPLYIPSTSLCPMFKVKHKHRLTLQKLLAHQKVSISHSRLNSHSLNKNIWLIKYYSTFYYTSIKLT